MGLFSKALRKPERGASAAKTAALEALQTNVMIADPDLNIVYMNPSVIALMREAEQDLKKELPRFSVATLIGSNIDVFHKSPSHQRKMLAVMDEMHSATITVGKRVFDLVVTPLFDGRERTGYVVEWSDARARLLNVDYSQKMTAISRTQAIVEFTVDGIILDANEQFLKTMGYTLDEIKGKHHRIFIAQDYANSPSYKQFWQELADGKFQADQFRRIGKGGKTVWIEGAYNPVLDANGKIAKIVKFANDVTAQANLLSDLKGLIDLNFGEIDTAIHQSQAESGSADGAAQQTLYSVQTVAAGTEQLAASIGEIARSMSSSQSAVDQAFEQSVQVGENAAKLTDAAQAMNGIVDLIRDVAGQINLLALNATIEAARAGDAGKGFAVVASEVKNLANQSARATEQISKEIEAIQATSSEVASAIVYIRRSVGEVRDFVTAAASAVEEQNSVTASISSDMQNASSFVSTVSHSIGGISSAIALVAGAVSKTKEAANILVK
jgi:PAS domain S-box-containing protein